MAPKPDWSGSLSSIVVSGHTLTVHGELGPDNEQAFQDALDELLTVDAEQYVIDISAVRYVSSACVGPIALLIVEARKKRRPVTVLVRRKAARLLELGGLDRLAEVRVVGEGR